MWVWVLVVSDSITGLPTVSIGHVAHAGGKELLAESQA